jgi:drug/metabolite transporter (DMT)-like permease
MGGLMLTLAGTLAGEWTRLDLSQASAASVAALLYLIVFGSVIAFTAYSWLLKVVPPARAATYAYVNPVVAIVLGWAIAGEPLGWRTVVAATMIVGSVMVMSGFRHQTRDR